MLREIVKRIFSIIPVLLIVITLAFFMTKYIPGGPFDDEKSLPPEIKAQMNEAYGLNKPVLYQYAKYVLNISKGNLGISMKYSGWDVSELIANKSIVSLELSIYAILVAIFVGIFIGALCAVFNNTFCGNILASISIFGICLPTFVSGPLLSYFFGYKLHWLPIVGWDSFSTKILPSLSLGMFFASYIAKLTHIEILNTLHKNYITFAKSKGLSNTRIFFIHILRNSMTSIIAFLGPTFAALLSGSIVTETIFHIPGMGKLFIEAIINRDLTLIIGVIIFYALLVSIFNIITDIITIILFPKQKCSR